MVAFNSPLGGGGVSESSVTQHQAALSLTESQVSDLQPYLTGITKSMVESVLTGVISSHSHSGGGVSIDHFQVRDDGSTGQLTTSGAVDLSGMWGTAFNPGSGFSWNGATGELTVDAASDVLHLDILVHSWNNLNNRHELHVQIQEQPPAGSYSTIMEASTYTSRNNTQDEGGVSIPGLKIFSVAAGTKYKLRVSDIGVAATIGASQIANQTYISAMRFS